jgi:hypothetical protein
VALIQVFDVYLCLADLINLKRPRPLLTYLRAASSTKLILRLLGAHPELKHTVIHLLWTSELCSYS